MKNIASTLSIVMAAGVTIAAIAAVSAAGAQVYTKGGFVENPQSRMSGASVSSHVGSVGQTFVVPTYAPAAPTPAAIPLTSFNPTTARTGTAAVALGPAPARAAPAPTTAPVATGPLTAPAVAVQVQSRAPQSTAGQCAPGRQAQAFGSPTINFRGVNYNYSATPPINIAGGAAIAAIYPSLNGQAEICYSGACISGPAGSCGAIAVAQPGGRMRVYVK